jgi:hypothetical protein
MIMKLVAVIATEFYHHHHVQVETHLNQKVKLLLGLHDVLAVML